MTDFTQFQNLTSSVPAGTTRTGKFRLAAPEQESFLDSFVEWLETQDGKTRGTAQSYRSHVAKAQFMSMSWEDMNSDIRSAVRALARFTETLS